MRVRCVDNGCYLDLVKGAEYDTKPDTEAEAHRYLRVVDESGEDYLYPERLFDIVTESK